MKKADIPKPKYNVGDTLIFKIHTLDHHGVGKTHRKVAVLEEIHIILNINKPIVRYVMGDYMINECDALKRILAADLEEPLTPAAALVKTIGDLRATGIENAEPAPNQN